MSRSSLKEGIAVFPLVHTDLLVSPAPLQTLNGCFPEISPMIMCIRPHTGLMRMTYPSIKLLEALQKVFQKAL